MCIIFECSEEIVLGIAPAVTLCCVRNVLCVSNPAFGGINLHFDSFINFDVLEVLSTFMVVHNTSMVEGNKAIQIIDKCSGLSPARNWLLLWLEIVS